MTANCAILIVTHDSEKVIDKAIESVRRQTLLPRRIILIDTGSSDRSYLSKYEESEDIEVIYAPKECGFCVGNNIGYNHVKDEVDYILLQNPDAFLFPDFIEKAMAFMEKKGNKKCGMVTGKVLGYDISNDTPSGRYDTTGIFRTWYGRWYDRGQGETCDDEHYNKLEEVPAICGCLMFCQTKALDETLIHGYEIFDSSFYMYKEDIDLSLRLRKKEWHLYYAPDLHAYHCRGWNPNRKMMPRKVRLTSARNEIKVQIRAFSPLGIIYSMLKYVSVLLLDF